MFVDTAMEEALTLLKTRLAEGVKASPLCLAVIGWLTEVPTIPYIVDIRRSDEGRVWLHLSDEDGLSPLCSFYEFLGQVRIICQVVKMSEEQSAQIVSLARHRLG
ncbi:MAG: hypothetical protein ABIY70_23745 [Capsulimonas sp.]|uniref:hypothetical protein n=1 Tax=Capsulimonas sp. TaxID=2494211 RepID=UPI00326478B0